MSHDCPNLHIEHRDGVLECLGGDAPECDHKGKPDRRTACSIVYDTTPCPHCAGEGVLTQ